MVRFIFRKLLLLKDFLSYQNIKRLVTTQSLIFSTTDQGNKRIGAKAALMKTKATPNEPHNYRHITHQSDHSPDPLY